MKKLFSGLLAAAFIFSAGSVLGAAKIRVGASPTPHAQLLEDAAKLLEPFGIELEIVEYSDYVQPNAALESGDLDANYFQHKPYLDDFNERKGAGLKSLGPVHYEPFGIYAGRVSDLKELKKNAVVAVPNDATNEGRALLLLQDQGLLKLDPASGLTATTRDITENPLELNIEEIEAAQLARALPDVDLAVINGNYAILGGLKIADALAVEAPDSRAASTYANVLAVREKDEKRPELLRLYEVLTSPEIGGRMKARYEGAVLPSVERKQP